MKRTVESAGSLRAGVTQNPVRLTQSMKQAVTRVTVGGAPGYVWPGGGITYMADATTLPENAFGSVPTPALVAPIEFTMTKVACEAPGGNMSGLRALADIARAGRHRARWHEEAHRRLRRGADPSNLIDLLSNALTIRPAATCPFRQEAVSLAQLSEGHKERLHRHGRSGAARRNERTDSHGADFIQTERRGEDRHGRLL